MAEVTFEAARLFIDVSGNIFAVHHGCGVTLHAEFSVWVTQQPFSRGLVRGMAPEARAAGNCSVRPRVFVGQPFVTSETCTGVVARGAVLSLMTCLALFFLEWRVFYNYRCDRSVPGFPCSRGGCIGVGHPVKKEAQRRVVAFCHSATGPDTEHSGQRHQ